MSIRRYILAAADHIRLNGYNFDIAEIRIPAREDDIGCAVGWTVYFARLGSLKHAFKRALLGDLPQGAYCSQPVFREYFGTTSSEFFGRMALFDERWHMDSERCSRAMYLYADQFHPEEHPVDLSRPGWMQMIDRENLAAIREFRFQDKLRTLIDKTRKAA